MIETLKRLWSHRLFVSVALTETGAVHVLRVRSAYLAFGAVFALSGWLGAVLAGDLAGARFKATLTGNQELSGYIDMIAELRAQRDAEREQVKMIAQELGVLQARLDRFDALGTKLQAEGTIISNADGSKDKGGPVEPERAGNMDMGEVRQQLGLLSQKADFAEMALETSLALSIRKSLGATGTQGMPSMWPVVAENVRLTSPFGWRSDPVHGTRAWHSGLDMAGPMGSPVIAAADGVITMSGWRFRYGNLVEIKHDNGFVTRYGHLQATTVKVGDRVQAGQLVALLGSTGRSTGPHVHFEVIKDGNRLNPYPFVKDTHAEVAQMARSGHGAELVAEWRKSRSTARK